MRKADAMRDAFYAVHAFLETGIRPTSWEEQVAALVELSCAVDDALDVVVPANDNPPTGWSRLVAATESLWGAA